MGYSQLSESDRELIFLGREKGKSIRMIAKEIGRNPATVSRELNRNKDPDGLYKPSSAQMLSKERRILANSQNHRKDPRVLNYVREKLILNWSPEQTAGRMKLDIPGFSISPETIYQYIYAKENRSLGLWVYLRRCRSRRSSWHERKPQKEKIPNRIFIDTRPRYVDQRLEYGHWETDLVLGTRTTRDAISVTVERRARYTILSKVKTASKEEKTRTTIESMGSLPPWLRRSITFDNGSENFGHEEIEKALRLSGFFCQPYSSWQIGTVENTNGLLRQYFPKRTSLADVTQRDLNLVATLLNDRPRKTLGYKTPYEVFSRELSVAVRSGI